ncbi:MAG TPA: 30S ribosomal protein S6, partial [Phycisphaerales bacterium]|nr:30S ribosomal protein S6 [Phycisphaerales bacterium]
MPGRREYTYEAMFLFSQGVAADLGGAIDHLKEIIARGHGEILAMRKWDDRRLAYEIDGQKRGVYILVYFKAPNDQLSHIERDCNLSEKVLRVLILRADHLSIEEIQAADARKELDAEGIQEHVRESLDRVFADKEVQVGGETMRMLEKHLMLNV